MFKPYDLELAGGRDGVYDSVSLMLVSKELCADGENNEPFTITFELHCDKDVDAETPFEWFGPLWAGKRNFDACSRHFEYDGPLGCEVTTLPVKPILGVIGAISLIAGLILCFYGAAIIDYAVTFIVFFLVTGVVLGIGNSMADFMQEDKTPLMAWTCGAVVVGLVGAFVFFKCFAKYGAGVLGVMGGAIVTMLVLAQFPTPTAVNIIVLIIVCGGVGYLGVKYDNKIKALGTAGCGAFMVVYGIASFFDAMPSLTGGNYEFHWAYVGILVGWLAFFFVGFHVQKKYLREKHSDYFSEGS